MSLTLIGVEGTGLEGEGGTLALVAPPGDPDPIPKFFVTPRERSNRGTSGITLPPASPTANFFECPLSLIDLLSPVFPFGVNGLVVPGFDIEGEGGLCDINSAAPLRL